MIYMPAAVWTPLSPIFKIRTFLDRTFLVAPVSAFVLRQPFTLGRSTPAAVRPIIEPIISTKYRNQCRQKFFDQGSEKIVKVEISRSIEWRVSSSKIDENLEWKSDNNFSKNKRFLDGLSPVIRTSCDHSFHLCHWYSPKLPQKKTVIILLAAMVIYDSLVRHCSADWI